MTEIGFWAHGPKRLHEGFAGDQPCAEARGQEEAPEEESVKAASRSKTSQGETSRDEPPRDKGSWNNAGQPASEGVGESGGTGAEGEDYQPTKKEIAKSLF